MFGVLKHIFGLLDAVSFINLEGGEVTISDFGHGGDMLEYQDER